MKKTQLPFIKGYRYRVYPNAVQREYLSKVFGTCRYVYNRTIAQLQKEYEAYKENPYLNTKLNINTFNLNAFLPMWKKEEGFEWIAEPPAQVLQQVMANVNTAYQNFFKCKKGYPKFKKKNGRQSATYPNQIYKITGSTLKLLKCPGEIKVKFHRELGEGNITSCTISKTPSGKYYASFLCEYFPKRSSGEDYVGVDLGIKDMFYLSSGEAIPNPKHYINSLQKLKRLQQSLSRKNKGSKNRNKARIRVARLHEKVANQRNDFIHNVSNRLVHENQVIGIESLYVSGMGRNRKLAKHIMSAGWGEFRKQLRYKVAESQKATLVEARPYFPSTQLCSCCGKKPTQKLALQIRHWVCEFCGSNHQRDHNASLNLENLARYVVAKELLANKDIGGRILISSSYAEVVS